MAVKISELTNTTTVTGDEVVPMVQNGVTKSVALGDIVPIRRTDAEIAALVTPTSYQYEPGDVRRYGADPTGVVDSAAALNRAVDVAASESAGGGKIRAPRGKYLIASEVTADFDRINIDGDGPRATEFWFAPSANGICFRFITSGSQQEQCGISNCSILSSDSTYEKVGIETVDGSNFTIENVEIGGTVVVDGVNQWSGGAGGSIGLRSLGRETLLSRNLYVSADKPIYIGVNPNFATIHTDHFHFHNTYLIGNDYPLVEVDPGVNITDLSFTGSNPWVKGTNAFKWNGTTTTISNTLVFENVGTEQFTGTTEFAFDIQANATGYLQNLYFKNCDVEATRHGLKARNVQRITDDNGQFAGGSGITNLDITFVQLTELHLRNTLVQASSTVTLTDAVLVEGSGFATAGSATPRTAYYAYDQGAVISQRHRLVGSGVEEWEYTGTLADSATLSLPWLRASHTHCKADVQAYSATGPTISDGMAAWSKGGTTSKSYGTTNFVVAAVGVELRVLDGGSGLTVVNVLGQSVTLTIKTWGK